MGKKLLQFSSWRVSRSLQESTYYKDSFPHSVTYISQQKCVINTSTSTNTMIVQITTTNLLISIARRFAPNPLYNNHSNSTKCRLNGSCEPRSNGLRGKCLKLLLSIWEKDRFYSLRRYKITITTNKCNILSWILDQFKWFSVCRRASNSKGDIKKTN